jgi:plastocyanin
MNRVTMRGAAAMAVIALLVAGCGDDEDDDVGAAGEGETTTSAAAEDEEAGATVEVTTVDYEFQGLPDTAAAGTVLSLVNESEAELHEIVAFRLDDAEDRSVEDLLALPEGEFDPGMPATVLLAPPGGEQITALGDGTLTEPGRYAVICAIPTGADPAAYLKAAQESQGGPPEVEGGPPHFTMGMYAEITVE